MKDYLVEKYKFLYKTKKCLFCYRPCKKDYRDSSGGNLNVNSSQYSWMDFTDFSCINCKVKHGQFSRGSNFHLDMGPTSEPHFMRFFIERFVIEINFDNNKVYLGDEEKCLFDRSIAIDGIDKFKFSFADPDKLYKKVSTYFHLS